VSTVRSLKVYDRVAAMNTMTRLGMPKAQPPSNQRTAFSAIRPAADLCNNAPPDRMPLSS
jgi:hypothetical protein